MDQVVLGKLKPKCSSGRSSQHQLKSCQEYHRAPLPFLAYINDIPETIIHSETRLIPSHKWDYRQPTGKLGK
jgi:hypothetical protein